MGSWQIPEFIVGEMKWIIEVYPSGHNKSDKESKSVIVFLTMLTKLSEEISKMTVCWTLYNKQTMSSYTSISEFTQSNNSFGFCAGILSQNELNKLKNTFDSKVVIGAKLTILNTINAKDVKAKIFKQIYPLDVSQNVFVKKCKFEWKIDENMMAKFKTAYNANILNRTRFMQICGHCVVHQMVIKKRMRAKLI